MQKELVICIIIVIAIIIGNVITHNNTKSAVAEVNRSLQEVSSRISENNKETSSKKTASEGNIKKEEGNIEKNSDDENIKKIEEAIVNSKEIWDKKYQTLAYYIEHDELEKVSEAIVKAKSNISAEEYNTAIENIDSCIFLLQHIEEKDKFSLKNIF